MWTNQQNTSLILGDASGTHIDITVDPPIELKNAGYTEAIIFYDSTATKYVALVADNNGDMLSYRWDGTNLTQIINLNNLNADLEGSLGTDIVNTAQLVADAVTQVKIANGAVSTAQLAVAAVTTTILADAAITTTKISDTAVTTTKISDTAVTTPKIAANAVTAAQIAANTITAAQIAANTITAAQIAAGTITAAQIAANTITAAQIAANTITAAQIAANTITAAQIAAGTITASQIAANAIVAGKIAAGAIDGMTITGALLRTAASGNRIEVTSNPPTAIKNAGYNEAILFWDSTGTKYTAMVVDNAGDQAVYLYDGTNLHELYGVIVSTPIFELYQKLYMFDPTGIDLQQMVLQIFSSNGRSNASTVTRLSGASPNTSIPSGVIDLISQTPDNTILPKITLYASTIQFEGVGSPTKATVIDNANNVFHPTNGGLYVGSTNSSSQVTINHGLSGTPSTAQITLANSAIANVLKPAITAMNATQIQVTFWNSTNGASIPGNPVEFYWQATL